MRYPSPDRARPGRVPGAILTWLAVASLLVSAGAGGTVAIPCAHHGHGGHGKSIPVDDRDGPDRLARERHPSPAHSNHAPDRQDNDGGECDCAGSCTLASSAPMERYAEVVTTLLGVDSVDLLAAAREPRAHLRAWLFPLPNAPPRS
jgi:hypothetical protein